MEAVGGRLYVCGGLGAREIFEDLFAFDPASRTWTDLTSLASGPRPSRMAYAGGAELGGRLYVFGGSSWGTSYLGEQRKSARYKESQRVCV
eukprot:3074227-Rhodomonas_salina.3